jgi:hypothetical protein
VAKSILALVLVLILPGCAARARTPSRVLEVREGLASYYGPGFDGRIMASGVRFDRNAMVAAHPTYPFGSVVRVTNLANGRAVDVRILDRGPAQGPRAAGVGWSAEGTYSYLVGHDLDPKRPVRRLPPQQAFLGVRYLPGGWVSWIEASTSLSGAQTHLSGGDVTDERIGAARRRSDITAFFGSALLGPFIRPGSDGVMGTADDSFAPTGETAAQIRDRVLPIGSVVNGVMVADDNTRVPLFTRTPAFVSVNLRAGLRLTDHLDVTLAVMNALDRNYRIHGSGVDAPGINAFAAVSVSY